MNYQCIYCMSMAIMNYLIGVCLPNCLQPPTYMSEWKLLQSQQDNLSETAFDHGLGEIPLKVITEINASTENSHYIFSASGSAKNDDDKQQTYGGIVYLYNDIEVRVYAPKKYNHHNSGAAMYTGSVQRWSGPFHEIYTSVYVRVKVWRKVDLPPPDYESSWINLDVSNESMVFQEYEHGLGDFPDMVVIQVKGFKNYISDAEGMSTSLSTKSLRQYGGVVYGYSASSVRIWTPGPDMGGIVSIADGWGNALFRDLVKKGSCKIYAWKFRDISPIYTYENSGVINTSSEISFKEPVVPEFALIVTEVQPLDGENSGFRFQALGSVMNDGIDEPYGGLIFGYNNEGFVMWKPVANSTTTNGFIFHIGYSWGNEMYSQGTNDVIVRITVWKLVSEDEVRCPLQMNDNQNEYSVKLEAYYNQKATLSGLTKHSHTTYVTTCQSNCTWSFSVKGFSEVQPTPKEDKDLHITYKLTNRYLRTLTSASDERASSKYIGSVSLFSLIIIFVILILSDIRNFMYRGKFQNRSRVRHA